MLRNESKLTHKKSCFLIQTVKCLSYPRTYTSQYTKCSFHFYTKIILYVLDVLEEVGRFWYLGLSLLPLLVTTSIGILTVLFQYSARTPSFHLCFGQPMLFLATENLKTLLSSLLSLLSFGSHDLPIPFSYLNLKSVCAKAKWWL